MHRIKSLIEEKKVERIQLAEVRAKLTGISYLIRRLSCRYVCYLSSLSNEH